MKRIWSRIVVLVSIACGTLSSTMGFAQPGLATASDSPEAHQQAVVLVAMTGNDTVDSQLRATAEALKQRIHERGYRDVDPARLNQALAEPGGIDSLRDRVQAACVLRVDVQAHDAFGVSLLLVVQTAAGEQTAQIQSSLAEVSAKTVAAADPLIPPAQTKSPAEVPSPPMEAVASPQSMDRVILLDGTVLQGQLVGFAGGQTVTFRTEDGNTLSIPWHQIQQILPNAKADAGAWNWGQKPAAEKVDWSQRGGSLLTLDLQLQILGMMARSDHPYVVQYPDGQTMRFTGDSPAGGGGGALGFHVGFMQMAIPDPSEGDMIWAFRVGTGIDIGAIAFAHRLKNTTNIGYLQDGEMQTPLKQEGGEIAWDFAKVIMIPFFLGGQVGSGRFVSDDEWRGVMFGLNWHPTYTAAKPDSLDSIRSFNYLGVQAHVDMGSIRANQPLEPNFQVTVTFLPQIDRDAMFASIGFGSVWY
ncbi:MAG TPA: hypothetical protein PKL73_03930 [Polyangiaceae bacterium]|jgi:hypothetical protein|nr:MAG: hypothetical protein BWY17_00452 [Deltaproteobacteria bacterium ADurb.Bin207]HNS96077.1 hypothetical protein [Polyangiaceae bacterium]HNZ20919.1 hypothetical protein [Polyangiaceae bacterium]HOD21492.1 hypothetical protein [Polyangiaceae bacterium]HOE47600.1 hypothetical protein [Polyangiaceae bacterium]